MLFRQGFDDLDEFVATYRGSISREGMLLRTDALYPEGTVLNIEITLAEAFPLIHGTAGVVRLMPGDQQTGQPNSVVLEFLELDHESKGLVDRLVDRFASEDVEPFPFYTYLEHGGRGIRRTQSGGHLDGARPPAAVALETPAAPGTSTRTATESDGGPFRFHGRTPTSRRWLVGFAASCAAVFGLTALAMTLIPRLPLTAAVAPESFVVTSAPVVASQVDTVEPEGYETTPLAESTHASAIPQTPPPEAAPLPPATSVQHIGFVDLANETVVTIEANGVFDRSSVGHFVMTDDTAPRLVVYLYGIGPGDLAYRSQVEGQRLAAIRVWYHDDKSPVQLHIVLDFAHVDVVSGGPEINGNRLLITLSDREPEAAGS